MSAAAESMEKYLRREWLESNEYQQKKKELNREINSRVFKVDYSEFSKSPKEKEEIFNAKWANLQERRKFYGVGNTAKHLNIPTRAMATPIHWTF